MALRTALAPNYSYSSQGLKVTLPESCSCYVFISAGVGPNRSILRQFSVSTSKLVSDISTMNPTSIVTNTLHVSCSENHPHRHTINHLPVSCVTVGCGRTSCLVFNEPFITILGLVLLKSNASGQNVHEFFSDGN
jgi:hypothetical protein